jgi:hypothetical protein
MIDPGLSVLDKGPPGAVDQKRGKRSSSDMKRMRIMGLCLVAVFAISAIGAVSASALPEVGRCVAKAKGKYTDANCTKLAVKPVIGTKERAKGSGGANGFTASGGEGVLETEGGTKVICKTQSAVGTYDEDTGAIKEVEGVTATFSGCELPIITASCQSGAEAGVIKTNVLQGPLGYISKAGKTVGQELTPFVKKGAFASFECGAGAVKIVVKEGAKLGHNCVIAPVANSDEMSLTAKQTYSGAAGKQNPQNFEGKTICNLESAANGGPAERATQALTTTVTNEVELEIFA